MKCKICDETADSIDPELCCACEAANQFNRNLIRVPTVGKSERIEMLQNMAKKAIESAPVRFAATGGISPV